MNIEVSKSISKLRTEEDNHNTEHQSSALQNCTVEEKMSIKPNDYDSANEKKMNMIEKENIYLKDQVGRLNKELSIYQEKLGKLPSSITSSSCVQYNKEESKIIDIPNCDVIAPLLHEYDRKIQDLSTFIERQGSVLDTCTQRSKDLLSENESLRRRIINGFQGRPVSFKEKDDINNDKKSEEMKELRQLQNDKVLLEEQAELLVRELKVSDSTIKTKDEHVVALTEEATNQLSTMKELNTKIQNLIGEKLTCEKLLLSRNKLLARKENEIADFRASIEQLHKDQSDMSTKVQCAGMDKQYLEVENKTLSTTTTESATLIQELRNQLISGASDYMNLNEEFIAIQKDLEKSKDELEKLQQSNTTLSLRVGVANEKENGLQNSQRQLQTKVKHLELARDKAVATSTSLQMEINRILQQQQPESQDCNSNLARWKKHTCQEIKRRDYVIHNLRLQNTELITKAEKDYRQCDSSQSQLANLERCIQKERTDHKILLDTLEKELFDINRIFAAEQKQRNNVMTEKMDLEQKYSSLQELNFANGREIQRLHDEGKRMRQEYAATKLSLQMNIDDLNTTLGEERTSFLEEKDGLVMAKDDIKYHIDVTSDINKCKNQQLTQSLEEYEKSNQIIRSQIESMQNKSITDLKCMQCQYQEKLVEIQVSFEEQIKQNQDLASNLCATREEKMKLQLSLKKMDGDLYKNNQRVKVAEDKVLYLTGQLHDNLSDQNDKLSQIKKLKMEVQQLKIERLHS